MTRIELIKPHTHAGTAYRPGSVLCVPETTAQWLIEHGVGCRAGAISAITAASVELPQAIPGEPRRARRTEAHPVSQPTPNKE